MDTPTPTEADFEEASDFLCRWNITMEVARDEDDIRIDLAQTITTARAEGLAIARRQVEAMRESCLYTIEECTYPWYSDSVVRFKINLLEQVRALPLPDPEPEPLTEESAHAAD